jgi:amino acid transporter
MDNNSGKCGTGCSGLMWWMTLVVAVLAVPSFGIMAASLMPGPELVQILVFILACWFSTFLGMRLMKDPKMHKMVDPKEKIKIDL